jgi:hypothetical protein
VQLAIWLASDEWVWGMGFFFSVLGVFTGDI